MGIDREEHGWVDHVDLWLYPLKIAAVLGLLFYFWPHYSELKGRIIRDRQEGILAITVGVLVYAAWVRMDWSWAMQGDAPGDGYDPFQVVTGAGYSCDCSNFRRLSSCSCYGGAVLALLPNTVP